MLRARRFVYLTVLVALVATLPAAAKADLPGGLRRPCDSLDQSLCLLPFPNDNFTTPADTATGLRVNILPAEMPRNAAGKPIDPTEWNRQDGFSPGSMVLTFVPGLDLHQSWGTTALSTGGANDPANNNYDIARYENADAPILLIDQQTGQRWPFWSELDMNSATAADQRVLIIRPAANFPEGHTILVALRNMRDATGAVIPATAEFAAYRDGTQGPLGDVNFDESRRANVSRIIGQIQTDEEARGFAFNRHDLFLAWKFTIASEQNLAGRVLHIRDDAFAQLGDVNLADGKIQGVAPRFAITSVTQETGGSAQRRVEGTISVPNYLNGPPQALATEQDPTGNLPNQAVTGDRFLYGPDGLPMQNPAFPTIDVPFVCTIPSPATAADPAIPTLYGHGLLGSRFESTGGSTERDRERDVMPCAVNWMGFAEYDIVNAVHTLADPSNMPAMADRSQQGFLNFLYLGRALAHPEGLATNAAFQDANGQPLFKTNANGEQNLVYDGNSQGGIMGGALCALSVDVRRCVLGVVGMNYSTLLNRSSDWEGPLVDPNNPGLPSYSSVLYTMFPNKMEQQLVMELIQMLWDRAEADGYAEHMTTDPFPNTPSHQVLMHVAVGDFQVSNWAAEVEARTIGARLLATSVPVRYWENNFAFNAPNQPYGLVPYTGADSGISAFVWWDSGNLPPPSWNVPPNTAVQTDDPHEDPRRDPRAADQKNEFWRTGVVDDVMSGAAHPYGTCRPGESSNIPRAPQQNFADDWCVPGTLASYGFAS